MNSQIEKIVNDVKRISLDNGATSVLLFGSYAKGTERMGSDIDIVIKGTNNFNTIKNEVDDLDTLETINLFDYDHITNLALKEDIEKYGKII